MTRTSTPLPADRCVGLVLALTFSTGVVDAVGFLGLDRVFVGNMTGNVVVLGMGAAGAAGAAGADDLPVVGPCLALAAFVVGAAVAGRVLRGGAAGWGRRTEALLGVVAVVLTGLTLTLLVEPHPPTGAAYAVTGGLGVAMGLQAAAARGVAVKDVTSVVVTSTITGWAADGWWGPRGRRALDRRVAAVALVLLGALCGALVLRGSVGGALGVSVVVVTATLLLGRRRRRATERSAGHLTG